MSAQVHSIHNALKAKQSADGSRAPGEGRSALDLLARLQTTLDIGQLLEIFADEASKFLPFDSLSYCNDLPSVQWQSGDPATHNCHYTLVMGSQALGELSFSRAKRFTPKETTVLEHLVGSLLYPLRNALMYAHAVRSAMTDPLTGVFNRAGFESVIHRDIDLAKRHRNPLALIVMDIDHFKVVNDTHGHLYGDCLIRDVAQCAVRCTRRSDSVFRYGGEEFAVLLNSTDTDGAVLLAERMRVAIEDLRGNYAGTELSVTVSLGVACLNTDDDADRLFARADRALYKAKRAGRNRVSADCGD